MGSWDTPGGGSSSWSTDDTTSVGIAVHPTPTDASVDYLVNTGQQLIFGTGGDGYTIYEKSDDEKLYILPTAEDNGIVMDTDGTVTLTGDVTGNADTSTKWASPVTVTASGGSNDVDFSFSIDGSGDVTINNSHINPLSVTGVMLYMGDDARGDLLFRGTANYERLPKGNTGQALIMDANEPTWDSFSTYVTTGVTAGTGLITGGTNGVVTVDMGTPTTVTASTTNGVTANSHTHAFDETDIVIECGNYT
jgi:hypothetical protein